MGSSSRLASAVIVIVAGFLSGCDAVVDCFDNDGPEFSTSTLSTATLNQGYSENIQAAINNEPRDDRFDYEFTIIGGALPDGITTAQLARTFVLRGTPTELGTFNFEVNVFVDDGLSAEDSGLCYRNRSKEFNLVVEQDNT